MSGDELRVNGAPASTGLGSYRGTYFFASALVTVIGLILLYNHDLIGGVIAGVGGVAFFGGLAYDQKDKFEAFVFSCFAKFLEIKKMGATVPKGLQEGSLENRIAYARANQICVIFKTPTRYVDVGPGHLFEYQRDFAPLELSQRIETGRCFVLECPDFVPPPPVIDVVPPAPPAPPMKVVYDTPTRLIASNLVDGTQTIMRKDIFTAFVISDRLKVYRQVGYQIISCSD